MLQAAAEALQALAAEREDARPKIAAAGAIWPLTQMLDTGLPTLTRTLKLRIALGFGVKNKIDNTTDIFTALSQLYLHYACLHTLNGLVIKHKLFRIVSQTDCCRSR